MLQDYVVAMCTTSVMTLLADVPAEVVCMYVFLCLFNAVTSWISIGICLVSSWYHIWQAVCILLFVVSADTPPRLLCPGRVHGPMELCCHEDIATEPVHTSRADSR